MTKQVHYHAIPAVLRGTSRGFPSKFVPTQIGKQVEEGCFKRISLVFTDKELTIEQLIEKKDALAKEYVNHIELAEALIEAEKNSRQPAPKVALSALDAEFEKFLTGDFMGFVAYVKANTAVVKQLRTFTNGKVESIQKGAITIKRDNNGSLVTMLYPLSTKLKVGDSVFVRDDGQKPIPTVQAIWVNVKDHFIRADQLKQFF